VHAKDRIRGDSADVGPSPAGAPAHPLLALQRLVGNRATVAVLARQPRPPKRTIPKSELEDRPVAVALRTTGARPFTGTPTVLRLQALMNYAQYFSESFAVDGVYGPRTTAGVKGIQAAHGAPETGAATPADVEWVEERAYFAHGKVKGLSLSDVWVGHEALRYIDDHQRSARQSLLSSMRHLKQLIVYDEMYDSYPQSELDYWEAVTEHANDSFQEARFLYETVLEEDKAGWDGLWENCRIQLEEVDKRRKPNSSIYSDPRLIDADH
jgi:peptidoglycan hydrolase-like protein with peptidoglycan-binding domain